MSGRLNGEREGREGKKERGSDRILRETADSKCQLRGHMEIYHCRSFLKFIHTYIHTYISACKTRELDSSNKYRNN